jgi:hypothetical protein
MIKIIKFTKLPVKEHGDIYIIDFEDNGIIIENNISPIKINDIIELDNKEFEVIDIDPKIGIRRTISGEPYIGIKIK